MERYEDAAAAWRELLADPRNRRVGPYVELARLLERRLRDIPGALAVSEECLALVSRGLLRPGPANSETGLPALRKRHERLSARQARLLAAAARPRRNRRLEAAAS